MNLLLKNSYASVLSNLKNEKFFIFGTTRCANIFYLFCKENHIENNIVAFIVSDISSVIKFPYINPKMHNIPIYDIKWLLENSQIKYGFIAEKEVTILNDLSKLFVEYYTGNAFFVSDFVSNLMYQKYNYKSYGNIIERYNTSNLIFGTFLISDIASDRKYKYKPILKLGYFPDENIFNDNVTLDELYEKDLGNYELINPLNETYTSELKCQIYMAKSHHDKPIIQEYDSACTLPIQVGASLTELDIEALKDNVGENISNRNRDYCEMTAIYWAWKNDKVNDYIGLCHYRRRFMVDENMISFIMSESYDIITGVPKINDNGVRSEYVEKFGFITSEIWDLIGETIRKMFPEYYSAWCDIENAYFLIICNMFIMKRIVFEEYCSFVFPVLESVDKHFLDKGIQHNNRYLGYIAECLTSTFVMKNKDRFKKAIVEVKFLEK